jgi:urea carboxylase
VGAGSKLKVGKIKDAGCRTYLAVRGGLDIPLYMGSKSTFTLGQFGGHGGRALIVGDVLGFLPETHCDEVTEISEDLIPSYFHHWDIGVLYGPHGAPDFFTDEDIEIFFQTDWEVHFNSARTGVRLIGPKPKWARSDGGEAGLHPSNIHDNAYAIGSIDFTGDMPVILGPDGPSLGGFVCPATVVKSELWKLGQLRPGDTIRFHAITRSIAKNSEENQISAINQLANVENYSKFALPFDSEHTLTESPILDQIHESADKLKVVFRQAGDKYILVEFGPLILDLNLRFMVHVLFAEVEKRNHSAIFEMTPGIRSLQIHYDSLQTSAEELVEFLKEVENNLPPIDEISIPSRIVHLPLSWDDPSTQLAIEKYMKGVYKDAPWCPSNIEFIRRINGLEDIQQVKEIVYGANYLVMGLGDVYLGAPVATPLDPRHRLVTTKYNPARTWTPENAVGIGGAYLCVYGMEGPGGYQFVGRTIQMWNRHRTTEFFKPNTPWLLRFFDQIKFYEVSESELKTAREEFLYGKYPIKIEETEFNLGKYNQFLKEESASIKSFRKTQQQAFAEERKRWEESGQLNIDETSLLDASTEEEIPLDCEVIASPVPGSVWKIQVHEGQEVIEGDVIAILESMKMEISVSSHCSGTIHKILVNEGQTSQQGQNLFIIRTNQLI